MPVIEHIKIRLKPEDVRKKLRLPEKYAGDVSLGKILEDVLSLLRPLAAYELFDITSKNDRFIEAGGVRFTSRVLARNVRGTERLFPFILTIGGMLESRAAAEDDLLRQYLMESLGDLALHATGRIVKESLCQTHGITRVSSMSPGSLSDWPIEEQKPLFSLMQKSSDTVGVSLTDSLLMVPRKSLSGVYFATKREFLSCRLCQRENCQGRLAPFDEVFKKSYMI